MCQSQSHAFDSTQLWEHYPEAMVPAFNRHETLVREAMTAHGGYVYKMIGDAFQVAFETAPAALAAATAAQRALQVVDWGAIGALKVRMALHTGVTEERGDDYIGPTLNRVARLLSAGYGGQILLNQTTFELLRGNLPEVTSLRDLGEHTLKDLAHPEHIYQVVASGLWDDFGSLKTGGPGPVSLPSQSTPFVGRETELNAIATLIDSTDCRLISLVGIGGSGKTRLAIQAAGQCRSFPHGVYFIALEAVETQDDMVHAIAGALKLDFQAATGAFPSPSYALNQLCAFFSGKKFLLVLDNFEHLINTASLVSDLLEHNSGLHLIVTSRERLNLPGEWVIEVGGLAFPGQVDLTHIQDYAAVQLFLKSAERSGGFTSGGEMPADAGDTQAIAGE